MLAEGMRAASVMLLVTGQLLVAACTSTGHGAAPAKHPPAVVVHEPLPVRQTPALDLRGAVNLDAIIPQLAGKRVVLVGERHNRFEHHQVQLEIIRGLHAHNDRLVIGMEMFQQPFQTVLDEYIAGNLSERELLRGTEYYRRWRFDFRHYAPILRFAREQGLPVVALNLPTELTRKVGRNGADSLTGDERAQLPAEIDRTDTAYEKRLRKVYGRHPDNSTHGFDNFLEVQLLWDEGMAEQAADYLMAHPDSTMVILAGNGHLAWGSGIPARLNRRLQTGSVVVLNGWEGALEADVADFILLPEQRHLPPRGAFGALLNQENDVLTVSSCIPDSPCQQAGLRRGDRFLSINGEPVNDMTDLHVMMWDRRPGHSVTLKIRRPRWFLQSEELSFRIELQ